MKLQIPTSLFIFSLTSLAFANQSIITAIPTLPDRLYVSAFGGGGSSNNFNASQFGTIFFTEATGGALAVNTFNKLHQNTSFWGAQLGYRAHEIFLDSMSWTLGLALELEAYSMNKRSFEGAFTNNISRLAEHDFVLSFPMRRTVFLGNAVFNFNNTCSLVQPYIGLGFGNAIVRISNATATSVNSPEPGINHYNSHVSDTSTTFAGQIKVGLGYDVSKCVSIFAEYRWLYLANADFVFGSTVYDIHAPTSSWQVKFDAQRYNLGNVGVRFNW